MIKMGSTLRTALLMGLLTAMLMLVGLVAGYITGVSLVYTLGVSLIMATILNLFMYWYADKWVLRLYRAKVVSEAEQPKLHAIVSRLATNAHIPKPKVAIIPIETPNAFATGRSPSHAVVAVTEGSMQLLNDEELEGVIGHELSHVKNRDMLINTLAAIVGAVISYVTYFSMFAGSRRDDRGGASWLAILAIVLVPFAAMLVRLSISRGREYGADEGGAIISHKPQALASALKKLETAAANRPLRGGNPSTAQLFIVNPFHSVSVLGLFSTHPPTAERIRRLELIAKRL
jgi:heat shock protein HtpX